MTQKGLPICENYTKHQISEPKTRKLVRAAQMIGLSKQPAQFHSNNVSVLQQLYALQIKLVENPEPVCITESRP